MVTLRWWFVELRVCRARSENVLSNRVISDAVQISWGIPRWRAMLFFLVLRLLWITEYSLFVTSWMNKNDSCYSRNRLSFFSSVRLHFFYPFCVLRRLLHFVVTDFISLFLVHSAAVAVSCLGSSCIPFEDRMFNPCIRKPTPGSSCVVDDAQIAARIVELVAFYFLVAAAVACLTIFVSSW
jgi:hypothetical protein